MKGASVVMAAGAQAPPTIAGRVAILKKNTIGKVDLGADADRLPLGSNCCHSINSLVSYVGEAFGQHR
jgi:hypothetical protein